jgi:hypothetical protein
VSVTAYPTATPGQIILDLGDTADSTGLFVLTAEECATLYDQLKQSYVESVLAVDPSGRIRSALG